MSDNWLSIDVRLGPPEARADIASRGYSARALLDTGASATVIGEPVLKKILGAYGNINIPILGTGEFQTASGTTTHHLVRLAIGLNLNGKSVHAEIMCVVVPLDIVLLGNDVLSALALNVKIDYKHRTLAFEQYEWRKFEDEVAAAYRALGGQVRSNVNLAGFQIDVFVREETQSKQELRLVVECKFYKDPVGNRIVNEFARVVATLKEANLADRGVLVSHAGFTQDASLVATAAGIDLLTLDDLQQQAAKQRIAIPSAAVPEVLQEASELPTKALYRCFVLMPFETELDDVYHLGIREAAAEVGGSCERADEIQHVGGIIEKVYDSIRRADVIIAEVTKPNANVYYEVGYAHALSKPVVLITRNIQSSPFDLRGYNHIVYTSIVDLRRRLVPMLGQIARDQLAPRNSRK